MRVSKCTGKNEREKELNEREKGHKFEINPISIIRNNSSRVKS